MPKCEGRPDGPCPMKKNDRTVHLSQGDLMLCTACENFRFPSTSTAVKAQNVGTVSQSADVDAGATAAAAAPGSSSATSIRFISTARPDDIGAVNKIVWNELLAYVSYYRNRANEEALRRVVLGFFPSESISDAKKLLIQEFHALNDLTQYITERRNSVARSAREAEVEDIVGILNVVDQKQGLDSFIFVASDFSGIPRYGPEELNVAAVVDRQVRMEDAVQNLSTIVAQLSTNTTIDSPGSGGALAGNTTASEIQKQLESFTNAVNQQLDHLNNVCSKFVESARSAGNVGPSARQPETQPPDRSADRSLNLMVFGIAEDRSGAVWRTNVDRALFHVTGRTVDVADAYRIGRYADDKTRPIVVKLRTVWDRRLVLANSFKLRNFDQRVYVAPDEPLEVRRKKTFDRIQSRATREGKATAVADGVLMVDGVATFSLANGRL